MRNEAPHGLVGYAEPTATLPETTVARSTELVHGDGVVVWEGNVISISCSNIVLTDLADSNLGTFLGTFLPTELPTVLRCRMQSVVLFTCVAADCMILPMGVRHLQGRA